jgi:hypothetical protein
LERGAEGRTTTPAGGAGRVVTTALVLQLDAPSDNNIAVITISFFIDKIFIVIDDI